MSSMKTHLQPKISFKVRGYQCFRSNRIGRSKGGILILVRINIDAIQTTTHMDDSEFQVLNVKKKDFYMKLVNLYSPNDKPLSLNALPAVGDFNSHAQSWGYDHIYKRGEEVENWQDDQKLNLINKPEDQPTFYSRRWRTTSCILHIRHRCAN